MLILFAFEDVTVEHSYENYFGNSENKAWKKLRRVVVEPITCATPV